MEKLLFSLAGFNKESRKDPTTVSDAFMAEALGVSTSYVNRMLSKFKDAGVISIEKKQGRRHISIIGNKALIHKFKKRKEKII